MPFPLSVTSSQTRSLRRQTTHSCVVLEAWTTHVVNARGSQSCPSARTNVESTLTAASSMIMLSLASDLVTKQLTYLFSSISGAPTDLAPTASCAANKLSKDGLNAKSTNRNEGRDDVVDCDVVYQDHVIAHISRSSEVASESSVGQLFHST